MLLPLWVLYEMQNQYFQQEMPPPRIEKEIRDFLGQLQYISQFISKLTSTQEPIFKLLRKNEPHTWNDECPKAFELIEEYLLYPPILKPPQHGKPLLLHLSIIENAVGSMLAQEDDDKNERAIYYLSKRFHNYEIRYTSIENSCFALVWAVQKLRHIILPFQTWVVARMDPLKYLFKKPALSGRLSRWLILLAEFDLKYVARKLSKGVSCRIFDYKVQSRSLIISLSKLLDHAIRVKLNLRWFNIFEAIHFSRQNICYIWQSRKFKVMQNRNVTKLGYFHLNLRVDYKEIERKGKEETRRQLNLAHYKINLSVKLGRTRLQPPSLSPSSSFSTAQLLQLLLFLTPPLGQSLLFFFFSSKRHRSWGCCGLRYRGGRAWIGRKRGRTGSNAKC